MENDELYQIALETIASQILKKYGKAGHVACALETSDGNIYTGICIDVPCSIGLCAEQSAIAEMLKHRETKIKKIVAAFEDGVVIAPCGRCREFIAQIDKENMNTEVVLDGNSNKKLSKLLPERWDIKWD